jgi:hypothetical protein
MKALLRLLLAFSSTVSLFACFFVIVYDRAGVWLVKDDVLKALTLELLRFQWLAFCMPSIGFIALIAMWKSGNVKSILVLSQLLLLFAFVWPLIAILLWQIERIKIVN